jgi:y4mF family transcriptional regulator
MSVSSLSGYLGRNLSGIAYKFLFGTFCVAERSFLTYLPVQDNIMTYLDSHAFGQAIRTARKAQGLRQDQLAGAAGVGVRFIVELEAGKPTAQLDRALRVAATLGLVVTVIEPMS